MAQNEIATIIKTFNLQKHPEGGYFKENYRSDGSIPNSVLGNAYNGNRSYATSIYFLLTSEDFSAFHKINQDEIWHFYKGSTLKLHLISKEGDYSFVMIGNNFKNNEVPQYVVKGGYWFAAEVVEKNSYSFVGCTVSPGFDFKDFVLPQRKILVELYPKHTTLITQLTHL